MNVLSLFDGMSCGQLALNKANIKYDKYYASEIDKYAIDIARKNYPNTIHLGDIQNVKGEDFIDNIDLIFGGSPCQSFSFAGKEQNFNDPRGKLFYEFARLLKELKPKYFLLENVMMKQEFQDVISKTLSDIYLETKFGNLFGVEPIKICSSLVSAQKRKRLYWTNIPNITLPKDKNILLSDILENDVCEPMLSNIYGGFKEKKPRQHYAKSVTIRANSGGGSIPSITKKSNKNEYRQLTVNEVEQLQTIPIDYTKGVSNTQRYKMIGNGWTVDVIAHILKGIGENHGNEKISIFKCAC